MARSLILLIALAAAAYGYGQRTYVASSILATGNWFKISVKDPGIYKVDIAFLNTLGINASGVPSSSIRLYGNGGQMLPESCSGTVHDDLVENSIEVVDGGDGIFNGADYFLFYASGSNAWLADTINHRFSHAENLYSNSSFYFISVGGTGKRVSLNSKVYTPVQTINSFNERYFHELDTVNFLSSGKNWYGEEFSTNPGITLTRSFAVPITGIITAEQGMLVSSCISRSINTPSIFTVKVNNTQLLTQSIAGVGESNQDLFAGSSEMTAGFNPSSSLSVTYEYQRGTGSAQGWLNWFEVFVRKALSLQGSNQLQFRDWNSVGPGTSGRFVVGGATPSTEVWDVSDPLTPVRMKASLNADELSFSNDCSSLHEYIAFNSSGFLVPTAIGKVANQDLHRSSPVDMLIVTYPGVVSQAQRLADFHSSKDHLNVSVATTTQIYNEFSSGSPDPTAIRDFVKMYFDKAGSDSTKRPRYLLLFGDASFDYKDRLKNNTNFVPAYQSSVSLDPLSTYTSDDYFGFLEDNDDINSASAANLLDIGIGRVPANSLQQATAFVDKVFHYTDPKTLGSWRNQLTFIADDEDYNLHFHDAETITATAASVNASFMQDKIYLDAFHEESNASGSRYPEVDQAIKDQVQNGTLIWNYSGHGSYRRLAEEVVLDQDIVDSWNNPDKLPLFITATCDFAPYDNPTINSLGENILLREKTGAIALMTTTRLVFAFSNRIMNQDYLLTALQQKADATYQSLGEAVKNAKNLTYQTYGDIINNRKFTLLGDPALTIAFPKYQVKTSTINGVPVNSIPDTLKALKQYTLTGQVTGPGGLAMPDFNGTLYTTVYDKASTETTLANDPQSISENFQVQNKILFKGKSDVHNGNFSFSFVVPQDIDYKFGEGKISYYADNGLADGNGSFTGFIIGGSQGVSSDLEGPQIKAFLDDENFVDGGTTGSQPLLIAKLHDTSGINIVGTAIGHDITAIIDGDTKNSFVLNNFFEADINTFRSGIVRFQLPALKDGLHTLKIKAWDVVNNSSETVVSFRTVNSQLSIVNVFNFPNPFTSKTVFRFTHNSSATSLQVAIKIYSVSGMLEKMIDRTIITGGNRSSDVEWDGKTDSGTELLSGIYYYQLTITTPDNKHAVKAGKLVIM